MTASAGDCCCRCRHSSNVLARCGETPLRVRSAASAANSENSGATTSTERLDIGGLPRTDLLTAGGRVGGNHAPAVFHIDTRVRRAPIQKNAETRRDAAEALLLQQLQDAAE